jgi:DNA-directed RNA polymerase subunit RPC12/RpoP
MLSDFKCSKCSGEMEEGLVVDLNYAGVLQSMWVEDPVGGSLGATTTPAKRKVKTITYRCSSCGHLDSYAR